MRVEVQKYKKSINEADFTDEEIKIVWDFYVTRSVAYSTSQKRTISDYGKHQFPWKEMLNIAKIDEGRKKILAANSINKTLENNDLNTTEGKK